MAIRRVLARFFCGLFICVSMVPSAFGGELFTYTDDEGRQHFVDSEKKVPEQYRDQLKDAAELPSISKVKPGREKLYEKRHYPSAIDGGKVEVFEASWCSVCKVLKKRLRKERIPFRAYDVEKNSRGRKFYKSVEGNSVPITRVNGSEIIYGADLKKIKAALAPPRRGASVRPVVETKTSKTRPSLSLELFETRISHPTLRFKLSTDYSL